MQNALKKPLSIAIRFALLLFVFLSFFSYLSAGHDVRLFLAKLLWSLFVAGVGLSIFRTGKIYRYRSILFILIAVFFFFEFKFFRFIFASHDIAPYCHIAQSSLLLNFFHNQWLAINSGEWRLWGVLTLGAFWLVLLFVTLGQGICSWVCFYGGLDEACSKLTRKPVIKFSVAKEWRDFPIAFLIFLLTMSFLEGTPVFCHWFCPLKLTTAFWNFDPLVRIAQILCFALILALFVVLLPALTKKRTFCSLICPFGALASICGRVSPYHVMIDQAKCIHCGQCHTACPSFAINEKSKEYKVTSYCNKCGRCVDVCPSDAIAVTGGNQGGIVVQRDQWSLTMTDLFVLLSLLLTGVISGTFVPRVLLQIIGVK
jgi:ferredoxin-type protein NapH